MVISKVKTEVFMDKMNFAPSEGEQTLDSENGVQPWHVLVIDDEQSVHDVSKLSFGRLEVFDQPVKIHSAFSAKEARELLSSDIDFCMAFVDVVMETDDAGLKLVDWIRNDLDNHEIRLILRTGQAGAAPEGEVIRNYDINDYRNKSELTSQTLNTCVYNGIRGYRDLHTIAKSLTSFRKLIETSTNLLKEDRLDTLASTAFIGLLDLFDVDNSSLYLTRRQEDIFSETSEKLISCTGKFSTASEQGFESLPPEVSSKINHAYQDKITILTDKEFVGYFTTGRKSASVLYVEFSGHASDLSAHMVELFATQAVLTFENLSRKEELETSQTELMYMVGDAIEARSMETGSHVKRVALYCEFLATKLDLPIDFIAALKIAAPLHDIGKITTPDRILHKPAKLDPDEWEIMKTHAAAGAQILNRSQLPIARLGARLAHWHHENWDGSGYPDGLKGEGIPIEARIMAIADVFDALGSKRCYKEKWPKAEISEFIASERGKKFDPQLVDICIEYFDVLYGIRERFPD